MDQTKNENWIRVYRGKEISAHRSQITRTQMLKERFSHRILRKVERMNEELKSLKELGNELIQHVYEQNVKSSQGEINHFFEFSCFDGSILIKRDMNSKYVFNDKKEDANNAIIYYLANNIVENKLRLLLGKFIELKDLEGTTVVKNLLILLDNVKDSQISALYIHLNKSIESSNDDPYFRVYLKDEEGKYNVIETALSKV